MANVLEKRSSYALGLSRTGRLLGVVHLQERDKPQPLGLCETPLRGRLLDRIVRRPGVLCPGPDPRTARDHLLRLEHI